VGNSPLGRALELVEAKRFEDAASFLRTEISRDELSPAETSDLCGVLGGVLTELGRMNEAEAAYRDAVARAIASSPDARTLQVAIARYMLAGHLLQSDNAIAALAEAESAIREEERGHALLHAVAAEALRELGRDEDARSAAFRAIRDASSDKMRTNLTNRLADLLSGDGRAG
jgi:predicted RNA polymerase sigma factor